MVLEGKTLHDFRRSGRIIEKDGIYLGFSGCFIEFNTDSRVLELTVTTDEAIEEQLQARVAIFIDDETQPVLDEMLSEKEKSFKTELGVGIHKVRIEKLSEAAFGYVCVKSITVDPGSKMWPTVAKDRRIEFIGDSITCGYGVEASCETDVFTTSQENAEKAYAAMSARALDAEYQLVSWSGIGTITNWVPEDVNDPLEEILMPDLYPYTDRRLCEKKGWELEKWDNSRYIPDLVVINLGTNDHSYTRNIPERVEYYGERFGRFLNQVHLANPDSAMLVILGVMGQDLCMEESRQVELFKQRFPETKIDFRVMPEQDSETDGYGADFHPSIPSQKKAANTLIGYIKDYMNW